MIALPLHAFAPAKINLGLFLGPTRADGRHELVSVMQSISLADKLTLEQAPGGERDEVLCPGVTGENLAERALTMFREATAWQGPPLRLTIDKRIPIAAGLGGGSADAAAALRLLHAASGLGSEALLLALAEQLGADVPAQVTPGRHLATGAGESLELLPDPVTPFGILVMAQASALSTADVYESADRLGLAREASALAEHRAALKSALELGAALPGDVRLLHNDLQAASIELCPAIELALARAREVGAEVTFVSGSGPTVLGLFARANGLARAQRAAAGLVGLQPEPLTAVPVDTGFGQPHPV